MNRLPVFHVYLNNKKVVTSGVKGQGVLSAIVSWVKRPTQAFDRKKSGSVEESILHVGGLITASNEHVRWVDRKLKIGDEIRIVIDRKGNINKPRHRKRINRAQELRAQKSYVKAMAEKFGWTIQTRP